MTVKASIILPVFNQLAYTQCCLESVWKNTSRPQGVELIVVDNGSGSETRGFLRKHRHKISAVLTNPRNRGAAAAWNQGAESAGGDILVFLHNDVVVPEEWLSRLLAPFERPSKASLAIALPVTNLSWGDRYLASADLAFIYAKHRPLAKAATTAEALMRFVRSFYESYHPPTAARADPAAGDRAIASFCLALTREAWRECGPFDEEFFPRGFEEDDFWARLQERGAEAVAAQELLLHHFGHVTSDGPDFSLRNHFPVNRERFRSKHPGAQALETPHPLVRATGAPPNRILHAANLSTVLAPALKLMSAVPLEKALTPREPTSRQPSLVNNCTSKARIATVCYAHLNLGMLSDMSTIRWIRMSEALARHGHLVDMVVSSAPGCPLPQVGSRRHPVRIVPYEAVRWQDYDVVKTLFHVGFENLAAANGADHPFIISKLGSVVGREEEDGVFFSGTVREELFATQQRISERARYVTVLTEASRRLWQKVHPGGPRVLLVPTGVDGRIPKPGADPYHDVVKPIAVYIGNIYDSTQKKVNLSWQERLNALGTALRKLGITLVFVGPGETELLDPRVVSVIGPVPYDRIWQYHYHANVGLVFAQGPCQHNESSKIYYYLRSGLPVVCEAPVPNSGLIAEAGLGFVVPYGDLPTFVDKVAQAVTTHWYPRPAKRLMVAEHSWYQRAVVYDRIIQKERAPREPAERSQAKGYRPKVLYVLPTMRVGGAEKVGLNLARRIDPNTVEMTLLFTYCRQPEDFALRRVFEELPVQMKVLSGSDADRVTQIRDVVREGNPDIIHNNYCQLTRNAISALGGRPAVIETVHMCVRETARWDQSLTDWLFYDRVVAVSGGVARCLARVRPDLDERRIRVIPNGTEIPPQSELFRCREEIRAKFGLGPSDLVVGTCGRMSPQKDVGTLLAGAGAAAAQLGQLRVMLVGVSGETEGFRLAHPGLVGRLILVPPQEDVTPYLAAMDIYVSSSLYEGMSVSILEAMAAGKAVIATRVGAAEEQIEDGRSGTLIDPRNCEQLTRALVLLAEAPDLRRRYGDEARRRVERHFTVRQQARLYQQLYRELVRRSPRRKPDRLRVVLAIPTLHTGGAEHLLLSLAKHLDHERFEVTAAVEFGYTKPLADQLKVTADRVRLFNGRDHGLLKAQWDKFLRYVKPHVVMTFLKTQVHDVAHRLHVPVIEKLASWTGRTWDLPKSYFAAVVTEYRAMAKELSRTSGLELDPHQLEVIYNGVDLKRFLPDPQAAPKAKLSLGLPADALVVGTLARVDPVKNLGLLLRASRALWERGLSFYLAICGRISDRAELDRLRRLAEAGGIADRVVFTGVRRDTPLVLQGFDVFALTSHSEGVPLALLEALAVGLPVVSTDVGGVREVGGDAVQVIPGDHVSALVQALYGLLTDPERRRELGTKARMIAARYDVRKMARSYERLFAKVIRAASARRPLLFLANAHWGASGGGESSQQLARAASARGRDWLYVNPAGTTIHSPRGPVSAADLHAFLTRRPLVVCELPTKAYLQTCTQMRENGCTAVYRNVDKWEEMPDNAWYSPEVEQQLMQQADRCWAASAAQRRQLSSKGTHVALLPNGVDVDLFSAGCLETPQPPRGFPKGTLTIGFWGSFYCDWFDWSLVSWAARMRPDWAFALVGGDANVLRRQHPNLPGNVFLLGSKPKEELPRCARLFDVAMVPYRESPASMAANPLKALEYLACGRPVVGYRNPSLRRLPYYFAYRTHNEFINLLEQAARTPVNVAALRYFLRRNTWTCRLDRILQEAEAEQQLISIVMPVYNRLLHLSKAVMSVVRQTYHNWELIIVDDGSTNADLRRALRTFQLFPGVRVLKTRHRGQGAAVNTGVRGCHGEYVCRLDSDDMLVPFALDMLAASIKVHADASYFYSSRYVIDEHDRVVGDIHSSVPFCRAKLARSYICNPLVCWRRQDFLAAGGIDETIPFAEDYDLALRMAATYNFARIAEPLYLVRVHAGGRVTDSYGIAEQRSRTEEVRRRHGPALLGGARGPNE